MTGAATLTQSLADFDALRTPTLTTVEGDIPYFTNEFWTAKQRASHSLHEVSYRACFKAQLPQFFIERLTAAGDAVHDPFMGRGTTPVQAALMGRKPVGHDINPLSVLLTRPRLAAPTVAQVAQRLAEIDWDAASREPQDLLAFYHPETLAKLGALKAWLLQRAPLSMAQPDPVDDWIRMVAINRLSGHSPGFFSGRSMPPNQAVSVKSQLRINEKLGVEPPVRDVSAIILKKTRTLLASGHPAPSPPATLLVGQAARTHAIPDNSIALTVTSPPLPRHRSVCSGQLAALLVRRHRRQHGRDRHAQNRSRLDRHGPRSSGGTGAYPAPGRACGV